MKKIIVMFLAAMMLFAFTACDNSTPETPDGYTDVSTSENLVTALTAGGKIRLTSDITIGIEPVAKSEGKAAFDFSRDITLDLNDYKLTVKNPIMLNGSQMEIKNGDLVFQVTSAGFTVQNGAIEVYSNSTITLDKVNFTSDVCGIFLVNCRENNRAVVKSSNIVAKGYYGIATNASAPVTTEASLVITDSEISTAGSTGFDNTAICFNVPGTTEITNSTLIGDRQGLMLRGGTHKITGGRIEATGNFTGEKDKYQNSNWGSGNEVPCAALVVGNRSSSAYAYPTTVNLDNVTLVAPEEYPSDIYVYQNNESNSVSVGGSFAQKVRVNAEKNGATFTAQQTTE